MSHRIGSAVADVVLFTKEGREIRYERLQRGVESPREFFYGFFKLETAGISAAMISTAGRQPGGLGTISDKLERGFAWLTRLGIRPLSARLSAARVPHAKVLMSFTDGFSLSLGLGLRRTTDRPVLVGGFHGLTDIEDRAPALLRGLVHGLIRRSLAQLDHAFFLGPTDREVAISRYCLVPERTSVMPFGVDTEFWRPLVAAHSEDFLVAVGQDVNRDYDLLAAAPGTHPIRIVTRRKVKIPAGADHVKIWTGDFYGADSLSDENLRLVYNKAIAVVVPLKNVNQPSGQSVTLQAMSCGRPVILSRIKGLWAPDLLKDGENCLLVPPGDPAALGAAIGRVRSDRELARRLGNAARETAVAHFGLDKIEKGTVLLARLGIRLWSERNGCSENPEKLEIA